MIACVGQQALSGKRTPDGFENRSLPHFRKFGMFKIYSVFFLSLENSAGKSFLRNYMFFVVFSQISWRKRICEE